MSEARSEMVMLRISMKVCLFEYISGGSVDVSNVATLTLSSAELGVSNFATV